MSIPQVAMFTAGACYLVASVAYVIEGRHWIGATTALYALACITVYMAGNQ